MSARALVVRIEALTGWDLVCAKLSERWGARRVARVLLRGPYEGFDVEGEVPLLIQMPSGGTWRVTDARGRVERARPDPRAGRVP